MLYQANDICLTYDQLFDLINRNALFKELVPEDASIEVFDECLHIKWASDIEPSI
jgi:hypothetical protein